MTNDKIRGPRHVIEAAKARDAVARTILQDAARELGAMAIAVIQKLRMEGDEFQIGYVGGVFAAGNLVLDPLRKEILSVAPGTNLTPPLVAPAEAAARMAHEHLQLALAG